MKVQKLIGARIKELRKELGETQEEMAFRAGIDKTYWNEVENGKRNVSVVNLGRIINSLEVSWSAFFDTRTFSRRIHDVSSKTQKVK
jgi:transcriptional regulator with XRE-family HTH domain